MAKIFGIALKMLYLCIANELRDMLVGTEDCDSQWNTGKLLENILFAMKKYIYILLSV
jgi:hypothetical protein